MSNSFDQIISRKNTQSIRWDKYPADVIPLWVADMDFVCPQFILDGLQKRLQHGILGYTYASETFKQKIVDYIDRQYGCLIEKEWITFLPSVVSGLHLAAQHLLGSSDHALVPSPAYHHFYDSVNQAGKQFSEFHMTLKDGRWVFSIDELEALVKPNTRLLMLCNPHNPGGTVFRKEELIELSDFCLKHQIILCSDEIHADLILDEGLRHTPLVGLNHLITENSFSLMSLNKVFNFPGIGLAWMVTKNVEIRRKMTAQIHASVPEPNLFAYLATELAMTPDSPSSDWYKELIIYLRHNRDLVEERIKTIPQLSMAHLESTYLAWIDASQLQLTDPQEYFLKAGVALSPGTQFRAPQFLRLNFGVPKTILSQALDRIEKACQLI
ncbi:MAG: PatB family C-S lyase [Betaproteobacteria bacterium]|jgi:aminotransferase/cystathionine beta-lyase